MGFPDKDFIKDFILIYQSHPALWKFKCPIYSYGKLREKGIAALIEFSKKKHNRVDEVFVKKKIKSLRNSFFREWHKVQKSKCKNSSTQNIYVPLLWYYDLISFISEEDVNDGVILSSTNDGLKNNMVQDDQNESTSDSVMPNCGEIYSMCVQNHKHKSKEKKSPVSINSESDDIFVESGKIQDLNIKIDKRKKDDISYSLKYHKSSVPDTEVNMPKIKCPKCDLQFFKCEYSLHLKRIHSHKCNLCDKMFVRVKTMQDHIVYKHKMDVNTNQTTNVPSFQTNQFQILKNMPIHINEPQTLNCSRNLAEHSLINDVHIRPVNSIGMKNIEGVNKSQTHLNNILFNELDQFIEVHELPTDIEITSIGIQNIGDSHLNELQPNRNNSLVEELSQFIEVNKLQTNIEINKDIMSQSKNLENIEKNTQTTQNICSICNLQFIYQHEYNKHMEEKHIYHKNNVHKLKNKNSNIEMSVNEPNHHLNKKTMYKSCGSQKSDYKTDINKSTSLQVDVKNNVSNIIPVIQQKGMKINRVGSVSCTSSIKSICNNNIIQSHPNLKLDAQIQSNITLVNKPGVQKEVEMIQEFIDSKNIVVDLSSEMEINEYVKFEDFENMQAGKDHINCSKNKGGLPIVPNSEQTHKNNIHKHDQQNEMLNLMHHNIQLQDEVAYPCKKKKPVTKHTEFVCNLCDSHLSCQSALKRHSLLNHIFNCDYCEKKFLHSRKLGEHIRSIHAYDNVNEMLKLKPDNIKKDNLVNQAAIYHINHNKNKGNSSIASNDEQNNENNNVHKHGQLNEIHLLHHNIQLQDTVDEKKPTIKHVCNLCDGQFLSQSRLKKHSDAIHKLSCPCCEKKFVQISALTKHIKSAHDNDNKNVYILQKHVDIPINQLNKRIMLENDKKADLANQAAIHQINCSENKSVLLTAQNKILQNAVPNPCDVKKRVIKRTEYICHICDGQFLSQSRLKKHSDAIHKLGCPHCEKRFVQISALAKHIKSAHDNDNKNFYILKKHVDIPINQLNKRIMLENDKKDDLANQASIHQINCSENKSVLLTAQNKILQNAVPNPCDVKKRVIKRSEYICHICDGQFLSQSRLKKHSDAIHKLGCPHCEKRFVQNVALMNHIRSAHDNDNKNSYILKKHVDIPTNQLDTGFTCTICGGQFGKTELLRNHSTEFHNINCPDCEKKFVCDRNLDKHIGNAHAFDNKNKMLKLQPNNIKKNDLANQAAIQQINYSNNIGIFPIVPNDEHTHENNVQEHNKPNEKLISLPYHIKLQDTVAYSSDEKMHVNKLKGFVCNSCGGQFKIKSEFNSHKGMDHKYKCTECPNKFIHNVTLQKHIQVMHVQHNKNACMEKSDAVTLSQQNEMLKLQPDLIKRDVLAIQAHEQQMNYSKSKSVLPIVLNDTYTNDVLEYGQQNQTQNVLQENIVSEETVVDKSNEMHINTIDKSSDFEDILPTISQTNRSNIYDVLEHSQLKETTNLELHNYQLQEEVPTQSNDNEHKKYICSICDGQYTSEREFNQHAQIKHIYDCKCCNKKFIDFITLNSHLQHSNIPKKNSRIEMLVDKPKQIDETSKLQSIDINMENLADREQFNCSEIKGVLPTALNDAQMCSSNLSKFVKPCKKRKFQLCQQEVADKDDEKQVNKYAQNVCNICNIPFNTTSELKRHTVRDHKFNCLYCEKKFVRSTTWKTHVRTEHKEKNIISLTTMTNTHNTKQSEPKKLETENQFICKYCDTQLKNYYELGYHKLKVHNFKCSFCVKTFIRFAEMERHKFAEHRDYFEKQNCNKKFWCEECNSWFITAESLKLHKKYAHIIIKPERFVCALCKIKYPNIEEFYEHVKLYHMHEKPFTETVQPTGVTIIPGFPIK